MSAILDERLAKVLKLGLIVNPVAGMGGKVGLKGTDGTRTLERALLLGAAPVTPRRSTEALKRLSLLGDRIHLFTGAGAMGEDVAKACGFKPRVIGPTTPRGNTTAEDTRQIARRLVAAGADLILFAGGDGTARDVYQAVGDGQVVLGIPSGVKMHSAVFACNPLCAGDLARDYLEGLTRVTRKVEVMDIDEEAFRQGCLSARLHGYLTIPYAALKVQSLKSGSPESDQYLREAIAADVIENMAEGCSYIIGPGTTTAPIMSRLDLPFTLLGVDLIRNRRLVGRDLGERDLLQKTVGYPCRIIVTPIGGQGYLFGRGNQQISAEVIRRAGLRNIIVVSTVEKLSSLAGSPLRVDSGDADLDRLLDGYVRVVTGFRSSSVYRISA